MSKGNDKDNGNGGGNGGEGGGSYWEGLSDEELLDTEVTTDDPEELEGLVTELPDDYEDSHVEYYYDLRGSGREEFVCVHGHHKHLCGFVMRKDDKRWLVGWMCGESIYGERFNQHKADYTTAVDRRNKLKKRRDVEEFTMPLTEWLNAAYASDVFERYEYVRNQLKTRLPWIWMNARSVLDGRSLAGKLSGPQTFFSESVDPKKSFEKILGDMSAINCTLEKEVELTEERVAWFKRAAEGLTCRVKKILDQMSELEEAFQPNILQVVCEAANRCDNPDKREYSFGMLSITCKRRQKADVIVEVPKNFMLPDERGLNAIKRALEDRGSH